jgi:pyruvate/2-oxoglutarate dehydrogenase complex dihydrolipoamide dehydrogenase (E3) component
MLATGAAPLTISVDGLDGVLTAEDVLTEAADTGDTVLIVGGGLVGIEVAEFLAVRGKHVTVIEMLGDIARDMEAITRKLTLERVKQLPIRLLTESVLESVDAGHAIVKGPEGERDLGAFDSVVVAVGTLPNHELAKPLRAKGLDVHVVGDAAELGQIAGAVRSAWVVACAV